MKLKTKIIKLIINTVVVCCSTAVTTLLYKYFHQEKNEVIFFYGPQQICDSHSLQTKNTFQKSECSRCKLYKIIGWLNEAKKTLDICVYMISHELLSDTVICAYERGIHVRIIVDEDNIKTTWKMGNIGIAKKINNKQYTNSLMHHKFIIIDNSQVILGSMNWTNAGIQNNWENIFITNDCELVNPYIKEFQKLWTQFNL